MLRFPQFTFVAVSWFGNLEEQLDLTNERERKMEQLGLLENDKIIS